MSTERLFIGLRPLTCNLFHLMNGEPEAATISPPIRAGLAGALCSSGAYCMLLQRQIYPVKPSYIRSL